MCIFNMVDESNGAWHAGVSKWGQFKGINDLSIGVEIVNRAADNKGVFTFPPYKTEQIEAVKQLAKDILARHADIPPTRVLGHSDVSAGRKSDPGPAFPWEELYKCGIGAWYDEPTKQRYEVQFKQTLPTKTDVIDKLSQYGYDTSDATTQQSYINLIRAFQLHFRPRKYDGILDAETAAVLFALVEKYCK